MTLKELLSTKNKRLLSIPDEFLSAIEKVQKSFFTELLARLDVIERENGFISADYANLIEATQIDLKDVLDETKYDEVVKKFTDQFDAQKELNDKYFKESNSDFNVDSKFANEVYSQAKDDAVRLLMDSPLDEKFLKPLEDILFDSVSTGASWRETLSSIREYAEGGDSVDGKLLQYSKQIAHDSFAYADRLYTNAVADEMESEWYFYSGAEIATTRCFCKERHEQYFHYKEIEAWGRGENLADCKVGNLWAGADPNTNAQTIFIYAGGFNCGHSIMPVSVFDVPKSVIERNMNNGNYRPSDAELEAIAA